MGFWNRVRFALHAAFRGRRGCRFAGVGAVQGLPEIPRTFDALCARAQQRVDRVVHTVDAMRPFVASAVASIVITVAGYHLALLGGASESAVAFAAAAVAAVAAVAAAAAVATVVAVVVAEEHHLQRRWSLTACAIEFLTIIGALSIGSVGGSIPVALGGIGALLILHRMHRRRSMRAPAAA